MKIVIAIICLFTLASCSKMSFENTAGIKLGMTKAEADKTIDHSYFMPDYADEHIFDLQKYGLDTKGKVELIVSKIAFGGSLQYYMFAFYDNKLIYWGFPQEYTKENDLLINQIGEIGAKIIHEKFMD